jgi:hypothetical protein
VNRPRAQWLLGLEQSLFPLDFAKFQAYLLRCTCSVSSLVYDMGVFDGVALGSFVEK